jgi:hypothetical protein
LLRIPVRRKSKIERPGSIPGASYDSDDDLDRCTPNVAEVRRNLTT